MTILEKLERKTASGHFPRTYINPDGPEASALIRELVEALEALTRAVNTNELAAAMACHDIIAFSNVEDALKLALPALSKVKPLSSPLGSDTDG